MITKNVQYHLNTHPANDVWPNGCIALYRIDGDQIARRIGFDSNGDVNRRDGWCGYIGMFETLEQVAEAIRQDGKL